LSLLGKEDRQGKAATNKVNHHLLLALQPLLEGTFGCVIVSPGRGVVCLAAGTRAGGLVSAPRPLGKVKGKKGRRLGWQRLQRVSLRQKLATAPRPHYARDGPWRRHIEGAPFL
jgi:hypothetical protein